MQCNAWREEWHSLALCSISSLRMPKICRGEEMAVFPGSFDCVEATRVQPAVTVGPIPARHSQSGRNTSRQGFAVRNRLKPDQHYWFPNSKGRRTNFLLLFCFAFGRGLVSRFEMSLPTSSYKGGGRDGKSWSRGLQRKQECDPTKFRL